MKNYLVGCDWGTSSFRLRLINRSNLQLIDEITSQEGIAHTFNTWKTNGENQGVSRESFFRQQLKKQVALLSLKAGIDLAGIPVVISGMATSSIGMEEVAYATLPFPVDGSLASTRQLAPDANFPHEITLISGIRTEHDVMRGEETQLIGLLALFETLHVAVDDSILIFPGTHSKHIYIRNQQVIHFQTFMTGEVFDLMAHYSILNDSILLSEQTPLPDGERDAFRLGVSESDGLSVLNTLFRVRTNQLFGKLTKGQNARYLSGLLIGSELKTLIDQPGWQLMLCSGNNLYELYKLAMNELGLSDRTTTISADLIDKATIAGQVKIAQNQLITLPK